MSQTTLALFFGNRGFFPESLIDLAKQEIVAQLDHLGIRSLLSPKTLTRYGAVEGAAEGRKYAAFLAENRGKFDGVLLVLPNFGDETGAAEALRDAGVPIYILAYPDELDKMDFHRRRDAFCGKLSVMDVFCQYGIAFTAWAPHVLGPHDPRFAEHMHDFAKVCRVVNGLKRCNIGAIGARPSAFKTIRFDEIAMQKKGITVDVLDNSDLLLAIGQVDSTAPECRAKRETFRQYCDFSLVPEASMERLVKLSVALDRLIAAHNWQALGLRCWMDLEQTLKISPCVVLSELNDRNFVAACELDICNAISMYALTLASEEPASCLDWNNNYGDDPEKCILFHCGPVPQKLMAAKGQVIDHPMFAKDLGAGCSFGCNVGRIKPMPFTYASTTTVDGELKFYVGEGEFTDDAIPDDYFGCGGVAKIAGLQEKLVRMGYENFRHHTSVGPGRHARALNEAFSRYLNYKKVML